jgi:tyrosyl-tRNA synthetase
MEPIFKKKPDDQYEQLTEGILEIISGKEFIEKLNQSYYRQQPLKIKWGADPSAPDIHLGHSVVLKKLRQFQDLGHRVQFLIGDFTAMIGDPTGKTVTRQPLSREQIEINSKTYLTQVFKVLDDDPEKIEIRFNSEWCRPMSFEDVIRLASKYTVARILERDDFSNRLKANRPIELHEILYPLIQGYDSVVLQCDVEMCGSDQKFNCLVARALQQESGQAPEVIISMPILEGLDGVKKMSKSYGNYIGLMDTPHDMFSKLMSISDALMMRYYALLWDSITESKDICDQVRQDQLHPKTAKLKLAHGITEQFHGKELADEAQTYFENRYQFSEEVSYTTHALKPGEYRISDLLVHLKLASSKAEAKRMVQQGAVLLGQFKQETPNQIKQFNYLISFQHGEHWLLKYGKTFLKLAIEL